MAREKGDQQYTDKHKLVGKQQVYALWVDAAGDPVLDANGNTQVIELSAGTDGKLKVIDNDLATEIAEIKTKLNGILDGSTPAVTQLSGSYLTVDPETGVKTVTSTAAELFAGLAALAGRYKMIVYNEGENNVYWGKDTVIPQTGFPLLPGDSVVFSFNPNEDMPIFFVAETNVVVRVGELA